MRVFLVAITLFLGMLAAMPSHASADIGPCNTCGQSSSTVNDGSVLSALLNAIDL